MLRFVVCLCFVALAVASPPVTRTREEIESFRQFLETKKIGSDPSATSDTWVDSGKFEGDILLDDFMAEEILKSYASGRHAYIWPNTRWPNNTVIWDVAEGYFNEEQVEAIEVGIREIESRTCVRFQKRTNEDAFVRVTGNPRGCFANVGFWRPRGIHTYNLAPNRPGFGCFRHTTIIHEWIHIIGFFHMHSTYNREEYVEVIWENIREGTEHNFRIIGPDMVSNLGLPYEYISNMHYWDTAFTINGRPTLVALQEFEGVMGQQQIVTDLDYLRINRHYNCPGAWD